MRWEYKTFGIYSIPGFFSSGAIDSEEFTRLLNEHGAEGWELVSVFDTNRTKGGTREVFAVLKRPVQDNK